MPNAIVTGGAQGIGFAITQQLVEKGFSVAIVDLQAYSPENTALAELMAQYPTQLYYYQCDISALEQHAVLLANINKDLGEIHCLVNNAGIAARPLTDILELGTEAFDRSIEINLRGTFFLTQLVANQMIACNQTQEIYHSIFFVTSVAAQLISTNRSQYCISKSALSTTAKLFARRLAEHHIYVHEIQPGFIQTAMTGSLGRTVVDEWIETGRVPHKRWGQPQEVGQTVCTLALGLLPFNTGNAFMVDGGLTLPMAP